MTQRRIYQCAFPYFVTFNVLNRECIFENKKKAQLLHKIILNAGRLKTHLVYQFAIMPDHVHILCQTGSHRGLENPRFDGGGFLDRSVDFPVRDTVTKCDCNFHHRYNISDFIKSIRGTFSHHMHEGQIWHPRFYDQIIENQDRLESTINYIQNNPTKAELPTKYRRSPYQFKDEKLIEGFYSSPSTSAN